MSAIQKTTIVLIIVLLAGTLGWYIFSGHSLGAHARYIPGNAAGVVTINTKRITADVLLGGKLTSDTSGMHARHMSQWKTAYDRNGGFGISLSSDIFLYGNYVTKDSLWFQGMVLRINDEEKLGSFLNTELPKLIDSLRIRAHSPETQKNYKSLLLGTGVSGSNFCVGYNAEAAVVLWQNSSRNDSALLLNELQHIFTQPQDSTLLAKENFRQAEKRACDVGFWFDMGNEGISHLLKTSQDSIPRPVVNAWMDFSKGEISLDMLAQYKTKNYPLAFRPKREGNDFPKILSKDKFMGLLHANLDLPNLLKNLGSRTDDPRFAHLFDKWHLNTKDVLSSFSGELDLGVNGLVHYQEKYVDYEYDAQFERKEVPKIRDARIPGFTMRLGLEGNNAMTKILPALMADSQIVSFKTGYKLNNEIPVYFYPSANAILISSSAEIPQERKDDSAGTLELQDLYRLHSFFVLINMPAIIESVDEGSGHKFPPNTVFDLFRSFTYTADQEKPGEVQLTLSLKFKDTGKNALVQCMEAGIKKAKESRH
ncbi:MAG TPA: DUF4836 family protein [Bacteroidia bacterium]|jgi:hypothetical protein|nr:DUF4836 family protein [Bacteroidia bacterium]